MLSTRVMTLPVFRYFPQSLSGERQTLASVFLSSNSFLRSFFVFFGGFYRSHDNSVAEKEKEGTHGKRAHVLSRVAQDMRHLEDNRMVSNLIVPDQVLFLIDHR
jgi:hypothetical protein